MSRERHTCLICTNNYVASSFYKHRNSIINDEFGFCKKCVNLHVTESDTDSLFSFLRTMNLPFLEVMWEKAKDGKSETVGTYLKMTNLKHNRDLEFQDGDNPFVDEDESKLRDFKEVSYEDFVVTDSMLKRWGRSLEKDDYIFLEEEFERLGGYDADDNIQESIYQNIARTQWLANKAIESGDSATYEKMIKILSTQMNDANVKPIQNKVGSEEGTQSWGEWVAIVEQTEPVEENEKDYDPKYLMSYIDRWFVTQIKRVFGKVKDEDIQKMDGEM